VKICVFSHRGEGGVNGVAFSGAPVGDGELDLRVAKWVEEKGRGWWSRKTGDNLGKKKTRLRVCAVRPAASFPEKGRIVWFSPSSRSSDGGGRGEESRGVGSIQEKNRRCEFEFAGGRFDDLLRFRGIGEKGISRVVKSLYTLGALANFGYWLAGWNRRES